MFTSYPFRCNKGLFKQLFLRYGKISVGFFDIPSSWPIQEKCRLSSSVISGNMSSVSNIFLKKILANILFNYVSILYTDKIRRITRLKIFLVPRIKERSEMDELNHIKSLTMLLLLDFHSCWFILMSCIFYYQT